MIALTPRRRTLLLTRTITVRRSVVIGTEISSPIRHSSLLNPSDIYSKGYDASGLDDEEIPDDEQEFSDDEAEEEAKRKRKYERHRRCIQPWLTLIASSPLRAD